MKYLSLAILTYIGLFYIWSQIPEPPKKKIPPAVYKYQGLLAGKAEAFATIEYHCREFKKLELVDGDGNTLVITCSIVYDI